MTELILMLIGLSIGFMLGWRLREIHAKSVVNRMLSDVSQEQSSHENTMNIEVVKEHDQFYVYDSKDNAFIVQVKTKQELFDFFKKTFPEKTVLMKNEHFALFDLDTTS